jgi:uncharacterized protein with PCYCGC motif
MVSTVLLLAGVASGVFLWLGRSATSGRAYALAPEYALPTNLRQAPPNVREAYRFAIANLETLRQIPCYCGCGKEGHKNNADCYVKEVKPDGSIVFDPMSFG